MSNQSTVTEFILLGFIGGPVMKISMFIILLLIYVVALAGNLALLIIIYLDHRLHTPMYFFLWNVSLLETLNISNTVPFILVHMFSVHTSTSLAYCFTQSFFYVYLAAIVFSLLPVMSYDRYVAVCNPLRYTTIVNGRFCIQSVIVSWVGSLLCIIGPVILVTRLPFCGPNIINHIFCDSLALLRLGCASTELTAWVIIISALSFLLSTLGLVIVSYIFIISTVLRIPITSGRRKAFSTCSSHLAMVTIGYGSAIFTKMSLALNPSIEVYKAVQMFASIMYPLMNPFIYTFSNKTVKQVLNQLMYRRHPLN